MVIPMNSAAEASGSHALACAGEILAKADAMMADQFDLRDLFAPSCYAEPAQVREQSLAEGRPLFRVDDWPVNPKAPDRVLATVREAWAQALSHCRKYGPLLDTRPCLLNASQLVQWALSGQAPLLPDESCVGESRDAAALVALLVARPFLRGAARALLVDLSMDHWHRRTCPIRGYSPAMAILVGETRERRLWCQWCDTCWSVDRVGCVLCGNRDSSTLRYFDTDPPSALRIDVCDSCKGYIKTCSIQQSPADLSRLLFEMELTSSGLDASISRLGFSPSGSAGRSEQE